MIIGRRTRRAAGGAVACGVTATIFLFLAIPGTSAVAVSDFAAIDAHVKASMEADGVPGLSYAIVEDGAVVHLAAFGVAGPGGRAMTPQTPVVIGSVGKSITALAIRQLIEAGTIDPAAPVSRYLPWFALAGPEGAAEHVTIQALLDHTSGLSTADGQDPRWYTPGRTSEEVVRALATVPAHGVAGTYEYSNLNYVVLGTVIEAVSGQTYGDYVTARIFAPLGMTRSHTSLDAAAADGPAQGHRYLFGAPVPFNEPYPTAIVPAGYQVSTAEDMASYLAALANGGVHDGADIVTGRVPAAGSPGYGTDWQPLTAALATAIIGQSGSTLTSNADIMELANRRLGVVVLLNANPTQLGGLPAGAADIALDVMRLVIGSSPGASAPTVRLVYLVVDAALLALLAALVIHAVRARTWRRRLAHGRRKGWLVARTVAADLVLPVAVLLGLPLWVGSTGSSPEADILAGWRFALWTLPDLAVAVLILGSCALALGAAKLLAVLSARSAAAARLDGVIGS